MISVIITTYNRYNYMLNAVNSVKNQTYFQSLDGHKNMEIIVVNDKSTQKEYYENDIPDVKMIHLEKNSKEIYGKNSRGSGGRGRNYGMAVAKGEYIAFLDDDDSWLPDKLEEQMKAIKKHNVKMSCTEGLYGSGQYDKNKKYLLYNKQKYWNYLSRKLKLKDDYPDLFDLDFIKRHNTIIVSSMLFHKSLYDKVGKMVEGVIAEDYDYWKRCLKYTKCVYVKLPLVYYDAGHGDGINY